MRFGSIQWCFVSATLEDGIYNEKMYQKTVGKSYFVGGRKLLSIRLVKTIDFEL